MRLAREYGDERLEASQSARINQCFLRLAQAPCQVMVTVSCVSGMACATQTARTTIDEAGPGIPQWRHFRPAVKAALVRRCETASVACVALDSGVP